MVQSRKTTGSWRWVTFLMLMLTLVVGCSTAAGDRDSVRGPAGAGNDDTRGGSEEPRLAQGGVTNPGDIKAGQIPRGGAAVSSNAAMYNQGDPVTVSWTGFPGGAQDWVAVARPGSADTAFIQWSYTSGVTAGSVVFNNLPAGNYVTRGYANNNFVRIAEGTQFTIAGGGPTTVTTDMATYTAGANAMVTWANAPGFSTDWVGLSVQGSPASSFVAYAYTGGAAGGTTALSTAGLSGSYVARLYSNNSFTIEAESAPFTVNMAGVPTVTTNAASYNNGDPVTVQWANLPGNQFDWVAIAPAGSPITTHIQDGYVNGAVNGSRVFNNVPAGTYVARAFRDDQYILLDESPVFTVGGGGGSTVTPGKLQYLQTETALVAFTNASGSTTDWVAIAPSGSPDTQFNVFQYTGGGTNGNVQLSLAGIPDGDYVARLFDNNTFVRRAQSVVFRIGPPVVTVTTGSPTYTVGQTVSVSWTGMPGNFYDWVSVATAGSPDTSFVQWVYISGQVNGTTGFQGLPAGTYVARAYQNNTFTRLAESATFTIAP